MLGPGSVVYGADAVGGVINYVTRDVPRADGWWGRAVARFEDERRDVIALTDLLDDSE